LSLPFSLRFMMVKEPKLLRKVERRLVEAVFRWQRHRAKGLGGTSKRVGGAVSFVQLFSSSVTLAPHVHLLAADGVWNDGVFMELPPPSPDEIEGVLKRMLERLAPEFESRQVRWPEDEYEALQARSAQSRLPLDDAPTPARRGRLAVMMGFSLHADTAVSPNDRQGLAQLVRYLSPSQLPPMEAGCFSFPLRASRRDLMRGRR
jgi:hypothetical protein